MDLKPLNQLNTANNRVANGRRLAARRVVMNTLASVPCQIWRKHVERQKDGQPVTASNPLSFEALAVSQQDEPNYRYEFLSMAYALMDKFNGGYVHKNFSLDNPSDITLMAQIELFDDRISSRLEQISHLPDIDLKEGDLVGMMLQAGFILWYEVVGMTGQTLMSDFGTKYALNRRDELQMQPIEGS